MWTREFIMILNMLQLRIFATVGSANGNHFGFQLATRFRKPLILQVTSESSEWLIFL